jgi:hypothetical protein
VSYQLNGHVVHRGSGCKSQSLVTIQLHLASPRCYCCCCLLRSSLDARIKVKVYIKNIRIIIHRTVTFPVVLCRCKNWSVTLREEHGLSVLQNRVTMMRRTSGHSLETFKRVDYFFPAQGEIKVIPLTTCFPFSSRSFILFGIILYARHFIYICMYIWLCN